MATIQEINSPIAENIKRIIVCKGIKQRFIADFAGFSENEFSAMLNGRKIIRATDLPLIAKALEVTPNELFATNVEGDEND